MGGVVTVRPRRRAKEEKVTYLADRLRQAAATVLVDYRGLRVAEETELRRQLREAAVEYRVVKNTLATIAAEQAGIRGLKPHLSGPTALAFSVQDPADAARVLAAFARDHPAVRFKAAVVSGRVVDEAGARALAELPPRPVLLAQVAAALAAPLASALGVLAAPLRGLVTMTEQLARTRAEGTGQAG